MPSASGSDPTINTTIKFAVPLATNSLYSPTLTCAVYDHIFRGLNQPMIGVFTIPIGQLMRDLQRARQEETARIQEINRELEKIAHSDAGTIKSYQNPKRTNHANYQTSINRGSLDESERLNDSGSDSGESIISSNSNKYMLEAASSSRHSKKAKPSKQRSKRSITDPIKRVIGGSQAIEQMRKALNSSRPGQ